MILKNLSGLEKICAAGHSTRWVQHLHSLQLVLNQSEFLFTRFQPWLEPLIGGQCLFIHLKKYFHVEILKGVLIFFYSTQTSRISTDAQINTYWHQQHRDCEAVLTVLERGYFFFNNGSTKVPGSRMCVNYLFNFCHHKQVKCIFSCKLNDGWDLLVIAQMYQQHQHFITSTNY